MWLTCEYCGNEADATVDGECRKCGAPRRRCGNVWPQMGMCAGTAVDMPMTMGVIYGGSAIWGLGKNEFGDVVYGMKT